MAPAAATISMAPSLSLSFPFFLPQRPPPPQQQQQQLNRKLRPLRAMSGSQSFQVTLRSPAGETVLCVPDDVYISDAAEAAGVELPISCRSGNCSACAAVLRSGEVDQSDQMFLDDARVAQGFVLTCVAYPLSDLVLETHQEARLYTDS